MRPPKTSASEPLLSRRLLLRRAGVVAGGVAGLALAGCGKNDRPVNSSPTGPSEAVPTASAVPAAPALYFPPSSGDTWEALDVNRAGWNEDALVDTATYAGAHNTAALLITQGGRIVLEQYWAGFGRHSSGDVASAQKSVTSILVGIAQARGLLKLDDAVSKHVGAGWTRAPAPAEQKITVRHLVTMTSGLNDRFEFEAEAGTLWYYNTPAYHMTKRVIERASGQTIEQFTDANLGRPIGWQDTSWKPRANMPMPDGSPMSGLYMSPRDCARFGLMVLAESSWSGKDVLTDKLYLHDALNSSTRLNPSYGYLWWLNGKASNVLPGKPTLREGPLVPAAPPDLVAAMGALDQRIYVVPSKRLVVVRQGRAASGDLGEALTSFDGEFWKRLSAALPR